MSALSSDGGSSRQGAIFFGVAVVAALGIVAYSARRHPTATSVGSPTSAAVTQSGSQETVQFEVHSTVAGASMRFGEETVPLPYKTDVPAASTPIAVEVTAAGHEGRRFYIKIDRPRSMLVSLPTGTGMVDATYEETEAALGVVADSPQQPQQGSQSAITAAVGRGQQQPFVRRRPDPPQPQVTQVTPPSPPPPTDTTPSASASSRHGQTLDRADPWR